MPEALGGGLPPTRTPRVVLNAMQRLEPLPLGTYLTLSPSLPPLDTSSSESSEITVMIAASRWPSSTSARYQNQRSTALEYKRCEFVAKASTASNSVEQAHATSSAIHSHKNTTTTRTAHYPLPQASLPASPAVATSTTAFSTTLPGHALKHCNKSAAFTLAKPCPASSIPMPSITSSSR